MSAIAKYVISLLLLFYTTGMAWGQVDGAMETIHTLPCDTVCPAIGDTGFAEQSGQLRPAYDMERLEAESEKRIFIIHVQIVLVLALSITVLLLFFYLFRFYRIKKELAAAVKKARRADEKTSGFLQNMSHEVQVFLQDISGLSDALIRESETGKKQEYAAEICSRNERAQRVIFDILDVSKIESGRMQFQYEKISLNGLAEEVCSSIRQNIPDDVEILLLPCEDRTFTADPARLNRALFNLLHYAATHTCGGRILIKYESRGNEVYFTISGENWTMAQEEYQSLFDRLAQTSGRLEEMKLEMLISRGLLLKMGGTWTVFPDSSGRTRIEFILPDHSLN